jgi:thioesterase domain-containing protein
MSLTKALEAELRAWNQPIITLERDTETLWPTLAATHAQHMAALQPEGAYVLGGHSLGGLLAFETAVCLERARSTVGAVFLLDSSHPQQFKVEWMDEAFDPLDVAMTHDEKEHALKQLTIMMKALNFNFDEVRWEGLKTEEKFKVFEDLSFQARS